MKKLLAFLLFSCTLAQFVLAQGTRIKLTQLEKGLVASTPTRGLVGITDNAGNQRYMVYVNVADNCITYTPTATGNTQNLNNFVQKCSTDSVWYIDFEGRSILLGRAGGSGTSDLDWLEIDNNQPPNNIRDSMYTYSYSSIGARMVWPGANFIVVDSTTSADQVIIGNRDARIALYNTLTGAWSSVNQSGGVSNVYLGPGTTTFQIAEASGTPTSPTTPFDAHFTVNAASDNIQMHKYGNARRDAGTPNNFLGTNNLGVLQSYAPEQLQPELVVDYSPGSPTIDPELYVTVDPNKGPFFARNTDGTNEIWQYDLESEIWVPYPLGGGGGGGLSIPAQRIPYGTGTGLTSDTRFVRDSVNNDVQLLGSNGNLSLRTDDTTGIITVKGDSLYTGKIVLQVKGDPENILRIDSDSRADSPPMAGFQIGRSFFEDISAAGDNQVFNMGVNYSAGGGLIDPYKNAQGIGFETSFRNPGSGNDHLPGYGYFETQFPEFIYSDTIRRIDGTKVATGVPRFTKRRGESWYVSNQSPLLGGGFSSTTDYITYNDFKNNAQKVQWGIGENSGYSKGIRFLDTAGIFFGRNNLGGIYQSNAAGSAMWRILHLDNSNRLVLFDGNQGGKIYTPTRELEVLNDFTIAPGNSQPLVLGRTTGTNEVQINTISPNVLKLTNSLDLNGYYLGSQAGEFWIRHAGNSRKVFRMDNDMPEYSIYGRAWGSGQGGLGLFQIPDFPVKFQVYDPTHLRRMIVMKNDNGQSAFYRSHLSPEGVITANPGDVALVNNASTGQLWIKETGTGNTGWQQAITATSTAFVKQIGLFSNTATARGLSIVADSLKLHAASYTLPGAVNVGAQTFAGPKTFQQGAATVVTPVISSNIFDEDGQGVGYSWVNGGTTEATIIASNPVGALVRNFAINVNNGSTLEPFYEVNGTSQTAKFNNAISYELENSGTTTWQATGRVSHINVTSSTTTVTLPEIVTGIPGTNQVNPGFELIISNDSGATVTVNRSGTTDTIGGATSTTVANNAGIILKAMTAEKWFVY